MKIIDIEPVQIWSNGQQLAADKFMLYNFHNYNFDGSPASVSYRVGIVEQQTDQLGHLSDVFRSLNEGSVIIPDSVVQIWGSDDEPIYTYTLNQLGLTEI